MQPPIKSNISDLLRHGAASFGNSPALTYKNITSSYVELWQNACGFASALGALEIRPGDRVAVLLDKRVETIVSIFGTAAARCVTVPINPVLRSQQVAYILADCDVRILVTSADRLAQLGTTSLTFHRWNMSSLSMARGQKQERMEGIQPPVRGSNWFQQKPTNLQRQASTVMLQLSSTPPEAPTRTSVASFLNPCFSSQSRGAVRLTAT